MKQVYQDKTGLWNFLKEAWDIAVERAHIHKALRLLSQQTWSVEFLAAMLHRAAKSYGSDLEMSLASPGGFTLTLRTSAGNNTPYKDEDILQHLDDDVKINQFIAAIHRKKQ